MKISRTRRIIHASVGLGALLGIAACGGGGNGGGNNAPPPPSIPPPPTTASGVFKDSNVSGLGFASGGQTGTTGTDGGFTYELEQPVTFSVGGVTIGSTPGASVATPIDLVPGGSSGTLEVQNIVRFLLMLDTDGDPTNGVTISSAVRTMSDMWAQVDFATTDLANELVTIIADAASVDGTLHALPDAAAAQSHLESTLLCVRAGAYQGNFTGDDSGVISMAVDASTGFVAGFALGANSELVTLSGIAAVGFDQAATFITTDVTSGTTYSGQFDGLDRISGTWERSQETGTFSATRFGSATDAVFRFTAVVTDVDFGTDVEGLFTFDVDDSNNVTGSSYSVSFNEFFDVTSGTVSGTTLAATYTDGGVVDGILDTKSGVLEGIDEIPGFGSITFSGSGCRLN